MLRVLLAGAVALALSACATTPAPHVDTAAAIAQADARLTQAEAAYDEAKRFVALFLPMLPAPHQARILAAEAVVEQALRMARTAVTAADRLAAAKVATDAVAQLRFISGT